MNNVRQITTAALMYADDNESFVPMGSRNMNSDNFTPTYIRGDMYAVLTQQYNADPSVWQCPSMGWTGTQTGSVHGSMYGCVPGSPWPDACDIPNVRSSYSYYANGFNDPLTGSVFQAGVEELLPTRLNDAKDASPMFGDHAFVWFFTTNPTYRCNHNYGDMVPAGQNMSYADGHVAWKSDHLPKVFPVAASTDCTAAHDSSGSWGMYWFNVAP